MTLLLAPVALVLGMREILTVSEELESDSGPYGDGGYIVSGTTAMRKNNNGLWNHYEFKQGKWTKST